MASSPSQSDLVGVVQLTSTTDIKANLQACATFAAQAARQGARWLLFPENAPYLGRDRQKLDVAQSIEGSMVQAFQHIAHDHQCWVSLGSFPEKSPSPDHTYNTQVIVAPTGDVHAVYRKLHLFDIDLPDGGRLEESASILPGATMVTTQVDMQQSWRVGLTICYDLRFPELYRALRMQHQVDVLTVPSAFTMQTGRAHWLELLRARAIENQCYVLASNQYGHHAPGRASFGHSVAFDPWGQMLACAPDRPGVFVAHLDKAVLQQIRTRMPTATHARSSAYDVPHEHHPRDCARPLPRLPQ